MKNDAMDFSQIETTISTIQNPDYKSFAQALHENVSKLIRDKAATGVKVGSDSARNIYFEYEKLVGQLQRQMPESEPTAFLENCRNASLQIKSSLLRKALTQTSTAEYEKLTAQNLKLIKENRQENMRVRDDYAVYTLTSLAYSCYLNIVSALVPGVNYHIPGYLMVLGALSVAASQATSPYESVTEAFDHAKDISDRVMSNSGLRKCLFLSYKLTEKISLTLADNLEPYVTGNRPNA